MPPHCQTGCGMPAEAWGTLVDASARHGWTPPPRDGAGDAGGCSHPRRHHRAAWGVPADASTLAAIVRRRKGCRWTPPLCCRGLANTSDRNGGRSRPLHCQQTPPPTPLSSDGAGVARGCSPPRHHHCTARGMPAHTPACAAVLRRLGGCQWTPTPRPQSLDGVGNAGELFCPLRGGASARAIVDGRCEGRLRTPPRAPLLLDSAPSCSLVSATQGWSLGLVAASLGGVVQLLLLSLHDRARPCHFTQGRSRVHHPLPRDRKGW